MPFPPIVVKIVKKQNLWYFPQLHDDFSGYMNLSNLTTIMIVMALLTRRLGDKKLSTATTLAL